MRVYVYVYIYIYIYTYICVCAYMYIYMCVCVCCARARVCISLFGLIYAGSVTGAGIAVHTNPCEWLSVRVAVARVALRQCAPTPCASVTVCDGIVALSWDRTCVTPAFSRDVIVISYNIWDGRGRIRPRADHRLAVCR